MKRKLLYFIFLIPIFTMLSGCVIPLHLFLTNCNSTDIIVKFENVAYGQPIVFNSGIKNNKKDLYYVDIDELEDKLDDFIEKINSDFKEPADTSTFYTIKLKPGQCLYFGEIPHFAEIYGVFYSSNIEIFRNEKQIFDKNMIAELFDRTNTFKVQKSLFIFGNKAKNVILYDRFDIQNEEKITRK